MQVYESLFLGADALLLIAAALERKRFQELLSLAYSLGMEVIAEVHTGEELRSVLDTEAEIIGINNRNLDDFTVDLRTTEAPRKSAGSGSGPAAGLIVSEAACVPRKTPPLSGRHRGVDASLVGEALMRSATRPDSSGPSSSGKKERPGGMTFVKLCGLTRREDVERASNSGASALGSLILVPGPPAASPREAAQELGVGGPPPVCRGGP